MLKLYAGNLSFDVTEEDLRELFGQLGTVQSVNVIKDKYTNRSKGFGFVEMASDEEAKRAIAELNGKEMHGRNIRVAEARPPRERFDSGGYGGGRRRY